MIPAENLLYYKSKGDRENKMCKMLVGQKQTHIIFNNTFYHHWSRENYKAINVRLSKQEIKQRLKEVKPPRRKLTPLLEYYRKKFTGLNCYGK